MYVGKPTPVTKQLIDVFEKVNSSVLGTIEVPQKETSRYGICIPKGEKKGTVTELSGVVEKPKAEEAPSRSAIGGRYVLTPTIFKYLRDQQRGVGNEIQLTDAILRLMSEEKVYACDMTGKRYDVGNKVDYIEAIIDFGLLKPEIKEDLMNMLKKKI